MNTLALRFSNDISKMGTTHERLKALADHLGVSLNKAAQYAINVAYEHVITELEMERAYKQHGQQIGKTTHLGASASFVSNAEKRLAEGVALHEIEDEAIENNIAFKVFLTDEQRLVVKAAETTAEKRRLIADFCKQNV